MITANLMGGLGNQLFQIFMTIAYSLRNNKKFAFLYQETLKIGIERNTYWNNFLSELKKYTTDSKQLLEFPKYSENHFHYQNIPQSLDNVKFFGYFQTSKYFQNEYEEIIKMINLEEQQKNIRQKYENYFQKSVISMHFRIGDYKEKQQYHPVMNNDYYKNALQKIIDLTKKDDWTIIYFCEKDDNYMVDKSIQHLKNQFPNTQFIKVDDNIIDWEQMLIMSICDHNIIANSTFSWWGAYFNSNKEKIVCYPSIWFGPALASTHNTKDLLPDEWMTINIH